MIILIFVFLNCRGRRFPDTSTEKTVSYTLPAGDNWLYTTLMQEIAIFEDFNAGDSGSYNSNTLPQETTGFIILYAG